MAESEQRGRTSRASSTSSLGREVRCGCQYYQSDSLLPERRALVGSRPSSFRTMQDQPAVRCSEHEYEPIAPPIPMPMAAPVVRITDTDVMPVADSDDSIDDRGGHLRTPPEPLLDGDVVLPMDGRIEDSAMEGRELVETGDTSEEIETAQQLQERLEERFLNAPTPGTESRTDGEVNTSQVDSTTLEELPLHRGARGLHQKLRNQAGKLRSRLRGIQRPIFVFADRPKKKTEKVSRSTSSGRSDKSRTEKRPGRIERIRSSLAERPRFSFPERAKFNFSERPIFHFPEKAKFHLPERRKFNIKRPSIRLPGAFTRSKKEERDPGADQEQQRSTTGSTNTGVGSTTRKTIFDVSSLPRIFERKSKNREEYATSSPKDSRGESAESATFPRARKNKGLPLSARWAQRFGDTAYIDEDRPEAATVTERTRPWRHPSLEEPRLSIRMEDEILQAAQSIPWEELQKRNLQEHEEEDEELRYMDYEEESADTSEQRARPSSQEASKTEELYEREPVHLDPRLYGDRMDSEPRNHHEAWQGGEETLMSEAEFMIVQRSRAMVEKDPSREAAIYRGSFPAVDPRKFEPRKMPSEEEGGLEIEDLEDVSAPSDKEQQQSSGSSCDRRRRGVIEEFDSDEFFLHEHGIRPNDENLKGMFLAGKIRDASVRVDQSRAVANEEALSVAPQRPARTRSLRKRKEGSVESYEAAPPARPKRERQIRRSGESMEEVAFDRSGSASRHRVVYHTEGSSHEVSIEEPLDDIVVVKPSRRKSKSSLRSQSQVPSDPARPSLETSPDREEFVQPVQTPVHPPPVAPSRRKRPRREKLQVAGADNDVMPICNGHSEWIEEGDGDAPAHPQSEFRLERIDSNLATSSEENLRNLAFRLREEDFVERVTPVPPKRRSRSRTTSVVQDEDRTSHGAESLPEAGYVEEEIPQDETDSAKDLAGYAIVDKREKPPRPPPPRRKKREKFATAPRPTAPKRPQRAYSTLGPLKSRPFKESPSTTFSEVTFRPADSTPYIEIDSDVDTDHKDLRSGEVLSKMQGRPLPAPPRPPRARREQFVLAGQTRSEDDYSTEITAATQTDPLPDDMVIEEEITQAKLIVTPSRSGSQVLVSTERIPTPTQISTPPVPPLPPLQLLHRGEEMQSRSDVGSEKAESPIEDDRISERMVTEQVDEEQVESSPPPQMSPRVQSTRAGNFMADETVRISSLEVGDLKVDRLSVSRLETDKLVASEVDALVISASEIKAMESSLRDTLSPSIIKELIAIRSHLENVATSQAQAVGQRPLDVSVRKSTEADIVPGIPIAQTESHRAPQPAEVTIVSANDPLVSTLNPSSNCKPDDLEKIMEKSASSTDHEGSEKSTLKISSSNAIILPSVVTSSDVKDSCVILPSSDTVERSSSELERDGRDVSCQSMDSPRISRETSSAPEEKKSAPRSRSRSRSSSPGIRAVRQTASPVRSLPPVISVTPDTPDAVPRDTPSIDAQPQRAIISYSTNTERSQGDSLRESSQSPIPNFPEGATHFIAFPASQIPSDFLPPTASPSRSVDQEPSIADTTQQLLRALRVGGLRAFRHFVAYLASRVGRDESREKIREVELALCALLLLVAGLLIACFGTPRTILHYHHWDYFNPPQ